MSNIQGDSGDNALPGTRGNDEIFGYAGNDTLRGGNGRDTLYGDEDNDMLFGGGKSDQLYGGANEDLLFGEGGADRLIGGTGVDTMNGGAGADILVGGADGQRDYYQFSSISDSPIGLNTYDTIKGFEQGRDKIHFDTLDLFGHDTTYVGPNASLDSLKLGEVTSVYDQAKNQTMVFAGHDDKAGADMQIAIEGKVNLKQSDFHFERDYLPEAGFTLQEFPIP